MADVVRDERKSGNMGGEASGKSEEGKAKESRINGPVAWFLGSAFILLGLMVAQWAFVRYKLRLDYDKAGQIGDSFGAVNAYFSGLALVGVFIAIRLQRQEMRDQEESSSRVREEQNKLIRLQTKVAKAQIRQAEAMMVIAKLTAIDMEIAHHSQIAKSKDKNSLANEDARLAVKMNTLRRSLLMRTLKPESSKSWNEFLLEQVKEHEGTLSFFEKIYKKNPSDPSSYNPIRDKYRRSELFQEMIDRWNAIREMTSMDTKTQLHERINEAIRIFRRTSPQFREPTIEADNLFFNAANVFLDSISDALEQPDPDIDSYGAYPT